MLLEAPGHSPCGCREDPPPTLHGLQAYFALVASRSVTPAPAPCVVSLRVSSVMSTMVTDQGPERMLLTNLICKDPVSKQGTETRGGTPVHLYGRHGSTYDQHAEGLSRS